jgi:transposase
MPKLAAGFVFTHHDRRRLTTALRRARDARHCRRVQAVLLVAEGHGVGGTASLLKASRRWVTKALARYRARRCPADLAECQRSGRPRIAPGLSTERLAELFHTDPLALGYAAASWTAPLLAAHLRRGGEAEGLCSLDISNSLKCPEIDKLLYQAAAVCTLVG